MKNDLNWIISGIIAAVLLPSLNYFGMPFPVAIVVALLAFAGLVILLSPRRLFEGLDVQPFGRNNIAFVTELLETAMPQADRLRDAASRIKDKTVKENVRHLESIARDVFDKVEANPGHANTVRRFLSYYLPRSAEISEGYASLESQRSPDPEKLAEVGGMVAKLDEAFVHYADSLLERELGTLDTDLRLIQASLKEDLGR